MGILERIIRAENKYLTEHGKAAKFLIISAADVDDLIVKVGSELNLPEADTHIYNVTEFRNKIICLVFDPAFSGFVLR
jgi:hypothetical protein